MMKKTAVWALIILSVLISGCASVPAPVLGDRDEPDEALVYGYVRMRGINMPYRMYLTDFVFKQLSPQVDLTEKDCAIYLGSVFFYRVKPGQFRIDSFRSYGKGMSFSGINDDPSLTINYIIPVQDNGFTVTKPGLYYFGTFDVTNQINYGFTTRNEVGYDIQMSSFPSEEDVIVRLLEIAQPGKYWEKMLQYRLKQLRQWRYYYEKKKNSAKVK